MSTSMPASASRSSIAASPSDGSGGGSGGSALGDPELRRFLVEYVKKRVPKSDVDDVVQTVFLDALAAANRPDDPAELRKWVVGIARHKCADVHRRAGRERPADEELPEQPAAPSPLEERSLVRWAEEQAQSSREAGKTLDWMAREGEGDKLEHIAEEEALPPARVRQRVSRMRRFLKERWLAEVALVAALGAMAFVVWAWLRKNDEPIVADPTKPPPSSDAPTLRELDRISQGRRIRVGGLEVCRAGEDQRCLDDLDRAKELDPAGDGTPEVREAREKAAGNLQRKQDEQNQQKQELDNQKQAPTNEDEALRKQELLEKTPGPAPKTAPKPNETTSPKAPPKAPPSKKDFDSNSKGSLFDLSDPPAPSVPPSKPSAPASPLTAPPPAKEPPASKAPAPGKGAKGGKPGGSDGRAPTFTQEQPSQTAPPQQMQTKK